MLRRILLPSIFAILAYGFWISPDFKVIAAGVAIFLFGMLSLEEGFRAFTGGFLEKLLQRATDRLWKSLGFGIVTTTLMQSSTLVSVITISFLSAGLLGLGEGIGIIFGANLGTTTGAWLVAGFGLKINLSAYAMPMLVFGIILLFQKRRTLKGLGYILSGIGFLFLGIQYMKEGFDTFRDTLDLTRYALPGLMGLLVFTLAGIAATVVMQSSHATLILTITALSAQQITYDNALALAIGANVGTTVTAILSAISANAQGRRLAGAHLVFNVTTALVAIALIEPLVWVVAYLADLLGIPDENFTLRLALFHTLFNLLGIGLMLPLTNRLIHLLSRVIRGEKVATKRPKYLVAAAVEFPDSAVEAVRKETLRIYKNAIRIIAHILGFSRRHLLSTESLERIAARHREIPPLDVDAAYQNTVKSLYSAVIAFISKAGFSWGESQSSRLHWLREAGRHLVEAVKDAKHLQKNLLRYAAAGNPAMQAEYQALRLQMAALLRELEAVRHADEGDAPILSLDAIKVAAGEVQAHFSERVYQLIAEGRITPEMGTSLLNDYGYARDILRNLIAAASTLFATDHPSTTAQRGIALDDDELAEAMKPSDTEPGARR